MKKQAWRVGLLKLCRRCPTLLPSHAYKVLLHNFLSALREKPRRYIRNALEKPKLLMAALLAAMPSAIMSLPEFYFGFSDDAARAALLVAASMAAWVAAAFALWALTKAVKKKGAPFRALLSATGLANIIVVFYSALTALAISAPIMLLILADTGAISEATAEVLGALVGIGFAAYIALSVALFALWLYAQYLIVSLSAKSGTGRNLTVFAIQLLVIAALNVMMAPIAKLPVQ